MNPIHRFDFTFPATFCKYTVLVPWLKKNAKKWAFQVEKGEETGYLHYQGRFSLFKKIRLSALINQVKLELPGIHLSCSSAAGAESLYIFKEHTKVEGPFTDENWKEIPRQVKEIQVLRPFQNTIIDSINDWDVRHINFVYDPIGCRGKSLIVNYLRAHQLARCLPPLNDYKDIMRMICDIPTASCYVFDMPRGLKKDKLGQFYAGIETIKDGYAFDDRYSFKEKIFDSPVVWVFGNKLPNMSLLSQDRWRVYEINNNYKLKPYYDEDIDWVSDESD